MLNADNTYIRDPEPSTQMKVPNFGYISPT